MNPSKDDLERLSPEAQALIDLARRSLGSMSLQQRSRGLARVTARSAKRRVGSPFRAVAGLAAAVAAVALLLTIWPRPAPPAVLSYALEGVVMAEDGSLRGGAEGAALSILRFSDGTVIELGQGARARLTTLSEHGARVSLDEGEVHAHVIHWQGSRWLFDAGPFAVTVTGTAFTLSWTPAEERIDLRLENGSVEVGGPVFDQPIAVRSGKWLTVRLRQREILLRDIVAGDGAPSPSSTSAQRAPGSAPFASPEGPGDDGAANDAGAQARPAPSGAEPGPGSASPDHAAQPKRDWAAMVAAGKLEEIIEDAERRGLGACLAEASSSELGSLADAARYTKKGGLAKQALLAQRQRFPGSRRATEAAFLLGRLAEGQEGAAAAVSWFEKYLAEAPSGAYAPEALGRKMMLVEKTSGRGAATKIAEEYLRRFPKGTYARAAAALLGAP